MGCDLRSLTIPFSEHLGLVGPPVLKYVVVATLHQCYVLKLSSPMLVLGHALCVQSVRSLNAVGHTLMF